MYRIRVFNTDGTLGGFYSDNGIVSDPSLAKTYNYDYQYKEDIFRAFKMSGGIRHPFITYNITTITEANEQSSLKNSFRYEASLTQAKTIKSNLTTPKQVLPPFEDKPSRSNIAEGIDAAPISYFDYDGGNLSQQQEIDIDGGVA